ncbi:50S ribosomal protein L29 [Candidatus Falkowbacteria bacterium]|nr:50S ribosomal protein L29 [Candidatus Falkowbacteria bacterium]
MQYSELKGKSEAELQRLLKSSRETLRDLRFRVANKQLKNIREVRMIKKTIAHLLTALQSLKTPVGK